MHVQVDVAFGDAVVPAIEDAVFPTLLVDMPAPRIRAYPRYSVVAEKLEAMIRLGVVNSRMKDFYDVWLLSRMFEFDGQTLTDAVRATVARRGTPLPAAAPVASRRHSTVTHRSTLSGGHSSGGRDSLTRLAT